MIIFQFTSSVSLFLTKNIWSRLNLKAYQEIRAFGIRYILTLICNWLIRFELIYIFLFPVKAINLTDVPETIPNNFKVQCIYKNFLTKYLSNIKGTKLHRIK